MNAEFLIAVTIKATLIFCIAFGAAALMKRGSASARHAIWRAAVVAVLALFVLSLLMPSWKVGQTALSIPLAAAGTVSGTSVAVPEAPAPPRAPVLPALSILWAAGAAALIARTITGAARAHWIARRARVLEVPEFSQFAHQVGVGRYVQVLVSSRAAVPFTFGIWRPVILLPTAAETWTTERRRVVLLHELVHIRRLDWLTQFAVQVACAVYWFHPLMWFSASRLREERERSCDDRVLALGTRGSLYAEHLVDLARALKPAPWSMEIAMAQPSDLEKRLAALLDPARDRRPVGGKSAFAITALGVAAAALLAPGVAPAQNSGITLSGIVYDASNARVPGAIVTATNTDTHGKEIAETDPAGAYKFAGIAAGTYTVEVKKPGFKLYQQPGVSLQPGVPREVDVTLDIGQIAEIISVVGKRPASQPEAPAQTKPPERIRVGGNVQATRLLTSVKPVYPQDAQDRGIEGTVLLRAVIGKDGALLSLSPVNSLVDPELTQAALDAVRQWRYQPTLLNGVPVEVVTTITINFRLEP